MKVEKEELRSKVHHLFSPLVEDSRWTQPLLPGFGLSDRCCQYMGQVEHGPLHEFPSGSLLLYWFFSSYYSVFFHEKAGGLRLWE